MSPIPANMLKAFASKGKKNPEDEELIDDGEQEVDELDVPESTSPEDAEHEAAESEEFEAGEKEGAAEAPEDEEEEDGEEIDLDALVALVEGGDGDPALMDLALDVTEDGNPPAWVMDEDVWDDAKAAVEDQKDKLTDYAAVVAHVYKAMGGEIAEASDEE